MPGPSPDDPHPMRGFPQVGFLKPLGKNPNIVVGEYSYYDDPDGPEQFEDKCVLYHFAFVGDNPAKVIKRRFPDEAIHELLTIKWWDWPVDKITRNLPAIVGADVAALKSAE